MKFIFFPVFKGFLIKYFQKKQKSVANPKKMRYTQVVLLKDEGACPSGGTGRRTGLKILRDLTLVPVQVRPWAPFKN